MDALISLIVVIILFAVAAYGVWWVCTKFGLPAPVLWLCGAVLLIIILYYIAGQLGPVSGFHVLPPRRP